MLSKYNSFSFINASFILVECIVVQLCGVSVLLLIIYFINGRNFNSIIQLCVLMSLVKMLTKEYVFPTVYELCRLIVLMLNLYHHLLDIHTSDIEHYPHCTAVWKITLEQFL